MINDCVCRHYGNRDAAYNTYLAVETGAKKLTAFVYKIVLWS